jgi:hypothetical protein
LGIFTNAIIHINNASQRSFISPNALPRKWRASRRAKCLIQRLNSECPPFGRDPTNYPSILKKFSRRPKLDSIYFNSIGTEKAMWMERAFEESEALCLDGFSLAFCQSCWEVLKEDSMNVFHEFHAQRKFERSLNATFISLIPKKVGAVYPIKPDFV